ncbi:prepilin-type N-terminal cleavage/methylation domain-containing protein [Anaerolentibacter hominis]|uniref:prepilin-type N-terminal cleavage/methylation domain-containing protein n=1 Tax=Anaerolentibacter hominis TaxID=3079009 RepID=UPI0031B88C6E
MMKQKNNHGFTLVELIVVIAVLVILVGLLAPNVIRYIEKSRDAKCRSAQDAVLRDYKYALTELMAVQTVTRADALDLLKKEIEGMGAKIQESATTITGICPSGGTYLYSVLGDDFDLTITCSKHGSDSGIDYSKALNHPKVTEYFNKKGVGESVDSSAQFGTTQSNASKFEQAVKEDYGIDLTGLSWKMVKTGKDNIDLYWTPVDIKSLDYNTEKDTRITVTRFNAATGKQETGTVKLSRKTTSAGYDKPYTYNVLDITTFQPES